MEKIAKGFASKALEYAKKIPKSEGFHHGVELAGLGTLAAPSAYHMVTGKDMSDKKKHVAELGGLGILAGPSMAHFAKKLFKKR